VELNWTTFILEMVNFLVLVWILKRFLYQPVLKVIAERQARIQASLEQARQSRQQAEQVRTQYENRLAEWQVEKQAAREDLQREHEVQRKQAMEELQTSLDAAQEKNQVVEERRLRELQEHQEREALELGARFAARLLERLAGPELEERILQLLEEQLSGLPEAQVADLQRALQANHQVIRVTSAYPMHQTRRQSLQQMLERRLGEQIHCSFHEEPRLIAGVRLSLGDWLLDANLQHELRAFLDTAREID
jgi:F-type H+-transporting ATPase subunit b